MGACASRQAAKPDLMPAYCIKNASLTKEHVATLRRSWKRCMDGTEAHRKYGKVRDSSTTHSNGSAEGSKTTTAEGGTADAEAALYSPIVFFYDTFYTRLFEVAPGVRPLFKESLKVQGRALVKMIDVAVRMVEDLPQLVPALQDLSRRHVRYGAKWAQYGPVGEVLLYTFKHCMGEEYTPEVETAWLTVYSVMMSVMLPVAYEEEQRLEKIRRKAMAPTGGLCSGKESVAVAAEPSGSPSPSGSGVVSGSGGSAADLNKGDSNAHSHAGSSGSVAATAAAAPSPASVSGGDTGGTGDVE